MIQSEEDKQEIEYLFEVTDTNKTGFIHLSALQIILDYIGYKIDIEQDLFDLASKYCDQDKNITVNEVFNLLTEVKLSRKEDIIATRIFEAFDIDKKGKIGRRELEHFSNQFNLDFSDEDFELMIKEADKNSDGSVDLYEFMHLFKRIKNFKQKVFS